jgi:hypothetical protein
MFVPCNGFYGQSLKDCRPGLPTVHQILGVFPEAQVDNGDALNSYSDLGAQFRNTETGAVFTLYERWDIPRIGADSDEGVAEFRAFLTGAVEGR